jgi:transposase
LKTSEEKVTRAIEQVAEGLSFESVARIEKVHPTTVQRWFTKAAEQASLVDKELVQDVKAEVIEMDELYSFAGNKQEVPATAEDETGKHWTHCAMERESRLLLAVEVGLRVEETACKLVKETASRLLKVLIPCGAAMVGIAMLKLFYKSLHCFFIRLEVLVKEVVHEKQNGLHLPLCVMDKLLNNTLKAEWSE